MLNPLLRRLELICMLGALSAAPAAFAAGGNNYELVVQDHAFQPKTLTVPAGERIKLVIKNHDATAMEFESYDLDREKVIVGHASATIYLGPLDPGKYKIFDDFRRATTTGTVIAKPQQ